MKFPTATHEFDELCFEYGIELDEDVSLISTNSMCSSVKAMLICCDFWPYDISDHRRGRCGPRQRSSKSAAPAQDRDTSESV